MSEINTHTSLGKWRFSRTFGPSGFVQTAECPLAPKRVRPGVPFLRPKAAAPFSKKSLCQL